jgi:hypothetical protein
MRRRLYFVLPDLGSAIRTGNDLLLARIEDGHMHFLARRGMSLGKLHEANFFQKTDLWHSMRLGFMVGGAAGLVAGVYIYLTPPDGAQLQLVTVLVATVVGALFGAWAASMIGVSVPNVSLKRFEATLGDGHVLLMVDVPKDRVEEIQELVHRRHPEASDHGLEPTIPVFP